MFKRFVSFVALAVAFSPIALSESQEISVDIHYDAELLAEEDGAVYVIKSIESQARQACGYTLPVSFVKKTDQACVSDIMTKAVNTIVAERHAEGLDTADSFANRATIELAALDQS